MKLIKLFGKSLAVAFAALSLTFMVGCDKKDDGGGGDDKGKAEEKGGDDKGGDAKS